MTKHLRPLLLTTLLAAAFGPLVERGQDSQDQESAKSTAEETLASMDWLAGNWIGEMWGGEFHAHYSTPAGGMVLSHSRLLHDGKESFYEFEVFEAVDDEVKLQPFPGGGKADGFTLASFDEKTRKAVFENPDKDFPTRIVYQRVEEDQLVITLSDPHGKSDKTEVFDLRR